MFFTTARSELIELVQLTTKIAAFDATLAARRDVQPEDVPLNVAWRGNIARSSCCASMNSAQRRRRAERPKSGMPTGRLQRANMVLPRLLTAVSASKRRCAQREGALALKV
jgi:hypothetical protein